MGETEWLNPSERVGWISNGAGMGRRGLSRRSRNDSMGSVVLAAPSSARASLFARYGPSIGPRLARASSCERIRDAIPFLPTESFRLNRTDSIGSVVLAAPSSARVSLFARYGPSIGPRLARASSCERIRNAIPFLPTESFRLSNVDHPLAPLATASRVPMPQSQQ
jgi:hypothetical protein